MLSEDWLRFRKPSMVFPARRKPSSMHRARHSSQATTTVRRLLLDLDSTALKIGMFPRGRMMKKNVT